jgi:O-antigen/teichoic acid export membrane protein
MAIGVFSGAAMLGLYSITLMAGNLLASLPNNLGIIIFPYLNEAYGASKDPAEVRKYLVTPNLFFATYLSILIAFLWVVSPLLVKIFLPKYAAGVGALKFSLFATLFTILSSAMGDALIAFKRYVWMLPLQLVIGGLAFGAATLALRAGWGITVVSEIDAAAFFVLWVAYSLIALRRVGTAGEVWKHIFEVSGAAGYFLAVVIAGDALVRDEGAYGTIVKGVVVAIASLPFLVAGEKRFRTFRLATEALRKRPKAIIVPTGVP